MASREQEKEKYLLKWSSGEPYEKSRRIYHNITSQQQPNSRPQQMENMSDIPSQYIYDGSGLENSAYSSSFYDEGSWDILNQTQALQGFKVSNKREDLDFKIADRCMMQQCGINPFLSQNNYINDLVNQDKYLKPINTSQN